MSSKPVIVGAERGVRAPSDVVQPRHLSAPTPVTELESRPGSLPATSPVVHLSEVAERSHHGGSTVLVRVLRRSLEDERHRTQEALTVAISLKKRNRDLIRALDEAQVRISRLESQVDRLRRGARRGNLDSRIDQLAARLVGEDPQ